MKKILLLTILAIPSLCLGASTPRAAAQPRRVVLLILDKITLSDLAGEGLPNLAWAAAHGGIALMNTRTGAGMAAENAYTTLGAGSRAVGTPESGAAYAAEEALEGGTAADVLRRNTGHIACPGNLVLPGIAAVNAANALEDHPVMPGLVGEKLHQAGLTTCAIGNGDVPGLPGRQVVSLAMDTRGVVDAGAVGTNLLREDREWPYGYRTDYAALLRAYDRLAGGAALVAIDAGDTTRIDAYSPSLAPERLSALRHKALRAFDDFFGALRRRLDPARTLILILSPSAGILAQEEANPMTPLVAVGPGFGPGWLTSATTRRPGIVTNMDVAPTILTFLGLETAPEIAGRPLQSVHGRGGMRELADLDARITITALWQQPVLKFFTVALDVIFAIGALFLLWPGLPGARLLQALLLLAAGFPLVLMLAPLRQESAHYLPWLAGLALALTALLMILPRRRYLPLSLLFAATVAVIVFDQCRGAPLARFSLLGYSPIVGSRFYGIGNEYMGVMIGAAVIGAGMAFARWHDRRWLMPAAALAFLALVIVMGAPMLGANFGGTAAAVTAFGLALFLLSGRRVPGRHLLTIAAAVFCALVILALADSLRSPAVQTHLGRAVTLIRQDGLSPFWQIVERKLAMNIKLIRYSGWSRVVVFAAGAMLVTGVVPYGRGRDFGTRHPHVAKAVQASLGGALAALVFNDSGIVAAGTLLIFPAATLLYLMIEESRTGTR